MAFYRELLGDLRLHVLAQNKKDPSNSRVFPSRGMLSYYGRSFLLVIEYKCQWFAETMYEERLLEFLESCSVDTIKNAFNIFKVSEIT